MRKAKPLLWPLLAICLGTVACSVQVDDAAARLFLERGGQASVTVLPVVLRSGAGTELDPESTERLCAGMINQRLARAVSSELPVSLSPGWSSGAEAMWRRSAREFRSWANSHPVATDYTLLAEFLMGTRMVGAVHIYVVDKMGRFAYSRLLTSEDQLFLETAPIGEVDCTNLVLGALRQNQRAGLRKTGGE